ncbi:MAG: sterol desaturase family protein [Rhizobiales bacterium]|nr:sterol desaturase family protein [Rhizobacter sp.]
MHTMTEVAHAPYPRLARFIERFGHPLFLAAALAVWWNSRRSDGVTLAILVVTLLLMGTLERLVPAVPDWRLTAGAKLRLAGVYVLGLVVSVGLIGAYEAVLAPALGGVRAGVGLALWPHGWPVLAQALLLYFGSDLLYFGVHRAIHNSSALWRITGHGFHHGFQNLHAINAGTNHPFELVLVVLPLVLLAAISGATGDAVAGAGVLLLVNTTLAHANVKMQTPGFSRLFTCSNQHRRHHSAVFDESNTNYACNAILWDQVFGTYGSGAVAQTGIGPTEPSLWRMFMLPFGEPEGVDTVSARASRRQK